MAAAVIMGKLEQAVFELLDAAIGSLGYELLGIEYLPQGKHSVLRIYIDSPSGILLEDCETVSKQVSGILDVEDPIKGQYNLEVSSPGTDRPLFRLEHFARFVGDKVRLRLLQKIDGRKRVTGVIVTTDEDAVVIHDLDDDKERRLPLAEIERAQLVPDWD